MLVAIIFPFNSFQENITFFKIHENFFSKCHFIFLIAIFVFLPVLFISFVILYFLYIMCIWFLLNSKIQFFTCPYPCNVYHYCHLFLFFREMYCLRYLLISFLYLCSSLFILLSINIFFCSFSTVSHYQKLVVFLIYYQGLVLLNYQTAGLVVGSDDKSTLLQVSNCELCKDALRWS